MTTRTLTRQEFGRRPVRSLLTLCGVAIGVAVLIAGTAAIEAARGAYRDLFISTAGKDALEVVACGATGFDARRTADLTSVSGVLALHPRIIATAALSETSGSVPVLIFGLDSTCVPEEYFSRSVGQPFATGAWLDAGTATAQGWAPGKILHLWTPSGPATLPLCGVVNPRGPAAVSGTAVLYMPLSLAQGLLTLHDQVNSVEIVLDETMDRGQIEADISARLPTGLKLQATGQRSALSQSTLLAVEHGLTALGLVALIASGFVVLNTVFLNLAERRGQLALLRALGATSGQVRRMLLLEGAVLGLAGGVLGTIVGEVLAVVIARALQGFLKVQLPPPSLSPRLLFAGVLIGPVLIVTAIGVALHRVGSRRLLPDLLGPRGARAENKTWRGGLVGLTLLAVGAFLHLCLCMGWRLPSPWPTAFAPCIATLLTGGALALPYVLNPLIGGFGWILRRVCGAQGRIAEYQLLRRPARTGLTAGVLFIAAASAVGFGEWMINSLHDLRQWYGRVIIADYLVRGAMPDSSFLLTAPLPHNLAAQLDEIQGIARVDKISFIPATVNGQPTLVLARTFAENKLPSLDLREGDPVAVRQALLRGETVIGTSLARKLNVGVGDQVTLETPHGPIALRVSGTVTEYAAGGDALYLEWKTAERLLSVPGVHAFLITARSRAAAVLAPALREYCSRNRLLLQSNEDLRGYIDGLMARVTGALWAMVALTFLVASLGAANTLALNVVEQARELSLLHALGMTGRQVRGMILGQAILLGLASLAPGMVAGVGLAALINWTANIEFGQHTVFVVNMPLILGCFVTGMFISVAAAIIPAYHAARLSSARDCL